MPGFQFNSSPVWIAGWLVLEARRLSVHESCFVTVVNAVSGVWKVLSVLVLGGSEKKGNPEQQTIDRGIVVGNILRKAVSMVLDFIHSFHSCYTMDAG